MKRRSGSIAWVLGTALLTTGPDSVGELVYPSGTEDFETLNVGDSVSVLGWIVVNTSAAPELFTVQAVDDPEPRPGSDSTRWLRVIDDDGANVQNRFYSPEILAQGNENYEWTFHVNLEATPPGGSASKPRFTIQHFNNTAFANAWGIEFRDTGAYLIVTGIGGTAASTPLYSYGPQTGVGKWVKLQILADFTLANVAASVNEGPYVTLPINLTGNRRFFRFCYRGEGTGNAMRMLLDDVSVAVTPLQPIPTVSAWGTLIMVLLILIYAKARLGGRRGATHRAVAD